QPCCSVYADVALVPSLGGIAQRSERLAGCSASRAASGRPSALLPIRHGECCFRLADARPRALRVPGAEVDAPDENGPAGISSGRPALLRPSGLAPDQLAERRAAPPHPQSTLPHPSQRKFVSTSGEKTRLTLEMLFPADDGARRATARPPSALPRSPPQRSHHAVQPPA